MDLSALPNGLHDASLFGLKVDYEGEDPRVVLRIDVDLSDENDEGGRRVGLMTFDKVAYVAIDPPARRFRLDEPMEIDYQRGGQPDATLGLGPDYILHTFYLGPLNAYLRIAAAPPRFEWES
jgi:hypothetical protein